MKLTKTCACIVLVCCSARAQAADATAELLAAAHAFGDAWAKNDVPTLERLLKDDYLHTDVSGHVQNRAEWLAYIRDRIARREGNSIRFADDKVRFYGDVAVVTGENVISPEADPTRTTRIRVTQVWVKVPVKGWQRAAFQATPIRE